MVSIDEWVSYSELSGDAGALAERVIRTPVIALQGSKIAPLLPQIQQCA